MTWMLEVKTACRRPEGNQQLVKLSGAKDLLWTLCDQLQEHLEQLDEDVQRGWIPPKGTLLTVQVALLVRNQQQDLPQLHSEPTQSKDSLTLPPRDDGPSSLPLSTPSGTSTATPASQGACPSTSGPVALPGRSGAPPTTRGSAAMRRP